MKTLLVILCMFLSLAQAQTVRKTESLRAGNTQVLYSAMGNEMEFKLQISVDQTATIVPPQKSGWSWSGSDVECNNGEDQLFSFSAGSSLAPADAFTDHVTGTVNPCSGNRGSGGNSFNYKLLAGNVELIPERTKVLIEQSTKISAYNLFSGGSEATGVLINVKNWISDSADVTLSSTLGGPLVGMDDILSEVYLKSSEEGRVNVSVNPGGDSLEVSAQVDVIPLDFGVISDGEEPVAGGNIHLVDNKTATLTINLPDDYDTEGVSFIVSATPKETGSLQNLKGTSVTFTATDDPLVFDTSKIYWYGVAPNALCGYSSHQYTFTVQLEGTSYSVSKDYYAIWYSNDAKMKGTVHPSSVIYPAELVPGVTGLYRCLIVFNDFAKTTEILGVPTGCQYNDIIEAEELYHEQQYVGGVNRDEGGCEDLYTAKGIKHHLGWVGSGPWYVYHSTPEGAEMAAYLAVVNGENDEVSTSNTVFENRRGYMEKKAKEHAGYNELSTYQCTYQGVYGANPSNPDHPAY